MTIWKYPIEVAKFQTLKVPKGAKLLTVFVQGGQPCIWALVDVSITDTEYIGILTFGTGQSDINIDDASYLGTYQMPETNVVGHVWTRGG